MKRLVDFSLMIMLTAALCACGGASGGGSATAADTDELDSSTDTMVAPTLDQLALGEVVEVELTEGLGRVTIQTPGGDERFIVTLASTELDAPGTLYNYSLILGPSNGELSTLSTLETCSIESADWRDKPLEVEPAPEGVAPAVGDERTFTIARQWNPELITAQAVAVGTSAIVWSDVSTQHPADLDADFAAEFLADFDQVILPRARTIFGTESDIDGNGRIHLLFTPLTYDTAVAYFSGCDLKALMGCPADNESELLYLTPPNTIPEPYNSAAAIKEILGHELGHLVHFARKVLPTTLEDWPDNSYIIEGLGALCQDLFGYQSGNLYVTRAGLQGINEFSMADILPDGRPYDQERDGLLRGNGYLFMRWLYDRAGGDEALSDGTLKSLGGPAFIRAITSDDPSIVSLLPEVTGSSLDDIMIDFYTTLSTSNRGLPDLNPCFEYLPTVEDPVTGKQRGANLFAEFHGMAMTGPEMQAAADADKQLLSGGVEYFLLNADSPTLSFSIETYPVAKPRVRIARVQ